jgi:hypothetical protein
MIEPGTFLWGLATEKIAARGILTLFPGFGAKDLASSVALEVAMSA